MRTAHTPGPWTAYRSTVTDKVTIRYQAPSNVNGRPSYTGYLATVETMGYDATQDANARLIAAAPELLDACRRLVKELGGTATHTCGYQMAAEAIFKATGDQ